MFFKRLITLPLALLLIILVFPFAWFTTDEQMYAENSLIHKINKFAVDLLDKFRDWV